MKPKIILLILIIVLSCKSRTGSKIGPAAIDKKTNIADTSIKAKTGPDNYIIDSTSNQEKGPVYMYCETMPEFPGGKSAFNDYMKNRIKYPPKAVLDKIEGRVVIKFIIRPGGEIDDLQILRSIRADLDNECLRVAKGMPEWKPGMINGKPVSVSFSTPVRFLLNDQEILNGIFILPPKKSSAPMHKTNP